MVFGETGQPYLEDLIANRVLSFWAKLEYDEIPRLSKHVLKLISIKNGLAIQSTPSRPEPGNFSFPWIDYVQRVLSEAGLSSSFNSTTPLDPKQLSSQAKRQLRDARTLKWRTEVESKDICSLYKSFKIEPSLEKFLSSSDMNANLRVSLARFRTRCNNLPVTRNRFKACSESRLKCELCNNGDIGDERHYLFECQYFSEHRCKLIPVEYLSKTNNVQDVSSLLAIEDLVVICKIAKFCKIIMKAFKTKPNDILSPLKVRSTHIMASGRVSSRPGHLNDYLV